MCGKDGVAGDVIITSRRRCTGSTSRRSQQSQETGLLARRARVRRKREKLEAWKLRIKGLEHELRLWERKEGAQKGSGISFKEEGDSEEVWGDCVEVEDDAECRRKLVEKRKPVQRECKRTSRSHCSINCKRWRKVEWCKRGHKRYKASRRREKYAESCLQPDTRNLYGTSGNILEDLSAPNEPTATCFGNARSLTNTHCELVSLNTGRLAAKAVELERNIQNFAIPTPRFARKFQLGILPLMQKELVRKIVWSGLGRAFRSRHFSVGK